MNDPSYVIIIQGLKQYKVCFCIGIKFFGGNIGHVSSSPMVTLNGLVTAFATLLPRQCKKTIILTFYMGKLRPSNFGGVLIPSAILTSVDSK